MKDLMKLKGAKRLSKNDQRSVKGMGPGPDFRCYSNWDCISTGRGVECFQGACIA